MNSGLPEPIIPPLLESSKLRIWKGLTLVDIVLGIVFFIIGIVLLVTIPLGWIPKIVIALIVTIFLFSLLLPSSKKGVRIYQLIILGIKFKSTKRHYVSNIQYLDEDEIIKADERNESISSGDKNKDLIEQRALVTEEEELKNSSDSLSKEQAQRLQDQIAKENAELTRKKELAKQKEERQKKKQDAKLAKKKAKEKNKTLKTMSIYSDDESDDDDETNW